ncbi:MAG: transporter substrate-binding domain-containing protein [Rubripirellula sp.]
MSVWRTLWSNQLGQVLLLLLGFVVLCAHLIWLAERGRSNGFDDRWLPGVGQGIWWTIVTMSTVGYGDFAPRTAISRILGVVVIFAGIILFGISVGALSSAFTIQRLTTSIETSADLKGQRVAVVAGTVAEQAVLQRGAFATSTDSLQSAFELVASRDVVAVVHDLPQLKHSISRSDGQFVLVGKPFDTRAYGIAFPAGSTLQQKVNVSLLELMQGHRSTYDAINVRWFGAN